MISITQTTHGPLIAGFNVCLRPISEGDLPQIREWRNSSFVRRQMLTTNEISCEQQQQWFANVRQSLNQQHWLILYREEPIGVTNVKSVNQELILPSSPVLEAGLYIGNEKYQGNLIAFSPTLAMYDYCFENLDTREFVAKVKVSNEAALKYNKALGYKIVHTTDLIHLSLVKRDYDKATSRIKKFLSRS